MTFMPCTARRRALIGCACLLLSSSAIADTLPPLEAGSLQPFYAVYGVGNDLLTAGSASLSLKQEGDVWTYQLRTRPEGVFKLTGKGRIRETTTFRVDPDMALGIAPITYQYRQDEERRRRVDASFDVEAGELSWEYRGERGSDSLETGLIDRFSATLVIKSALETGFDEVEIAVFDNGRIKPTRFTVDGRETVETDIGRFDTIRVLSRRTDSASRETITWFAPALDYLPVLIEQRKRGDLVARMRLERYEGPTTDADN